ncbi:hypothetical protein HLB23_06600 [Nocardia uniformis]|uniref:Uncharacterized protein n=1 Tax=Nocardia uniformis TaxID=53432 RepID=A0A849C3J2_9NOCA|nr:hypothetical protein [Nocardia uniformis]NNH69539.1 hypothetical protein [Nocardia uniformis]
MFELVLPLVAGVAAPAIGGLLYGLAYHHVLVPLNEAFRYHGGPRFTGRRPALAVAHSCAAEHEPGACPCPPRRQRTILEYHGADWRRRCFPVPGRYPLDAEVPVHVSYTSNRPYPLTRITVVRSAIRGTAAGFAIGLVVIAMMCVTLYV